LGFRTVERRMFGNDECLVHRLNRTDYLASLGSRSSTSV
jgi:hypothetical protein